MDIKLLLIDTSAENPADETHHLLSPITMDPSPKYDDRSPTYLDSPNISTGMAALLNAASLESELCGPFKSGTGIRLPPISLISPPDSAISEAFSLESLYSNPRQHIHRTSTTSSIASHSINDLCVKGLAADEMSKIFRVAKAKRSPAKAKRDAAMLSLLFDLKLPCQKIADLKLMDIKGILDGSFEGIFFTSSKDTERLRSVRCHPYTAKCIKEWVKVCETEFRWPYHDMAPVFVPLSSGVEISNPKRIFLKRDAVSKVFTALKTAAGVSMSKETVNQTNFADYASLEV